MAKITKKRMAILHHIAAGANRVTDLKKVMKGQITELGIIKALKDMESEGYVIREPTGRGREKKIILTSKAKALISGRSPEDLKNDILREIAFLKADDCKKVFKSVILLGTVPEEIGLNQDLVYKCVDRLLKKKILIKDGNKLVLSNFGLLATAQLDPELKSFAKGWILEKSRAGVKDILRGSPLYEGIDDFLTEYIGVFERSLDKVLEDGHHILFSLMSGVTYEDLLKDEKLFQDVNKRIYNEHIIEILTKEVVSKFIIRFMRF
jgi:DNA-binding MarR family transcriptional regulator